MIWRNKEDRSLTPDQFAELRARYSGQNIVVERDGSYYWIFVDDEPVAKAILLSDAFRQAVRSPM